MAREKILVVDDEPLIVKSIVTALSREKHEGRLVKGVLSAQEALELVKKEEFDLMVVDIIMPEMGGLELLRRVRQVCPDIAVVIITGYGTIEISIESLKAGAQSFLLKPFTIEELRAAVNEALEKIRLTQENARLKAIQAQEDERRRMSIEIHDSVVQWLVGAFYRAQACEMLLSQRKTEEARSEMGHIEKALEESMKELRRIIASLYPPLLHEQGLKAILQNVEEFQQDTGIICHLQVEGEPWQFLPSSEILIYRIIKEALNNVKKHSSATEVSVRLRFQPEQALIEVHDNGKGFNLLKAMDNALTRGHLGLVSMKDKAEMLGGTLGIETNPGAGTSICLTLPHACMGSTHTT